MSYLLADSHTHIFSEQFDEDRKEVMERASQAGIHMMVLPNIDTTSIDRVIVTAKDYPTKVFYALGIHPEAINQNYLNKLEVCHSYIKEYHTEEHMVAIGEIGLDFYWDDTFRYQQELALRKQFEWAIDYDLPVVLHTRNAHFEMIHAVEEYISSGLRGVFHSFDGSRDELDRLLKFDTFYIGVNGIVTFKKNEELRYTVAQIPINRLLLETDAPYLSPHPLRGKRNEPSHLIHILNVIADIKKMLPEELATFTYNNTERLFSKSIVRES